MRHLRSFLLTAAACAFCAAPAAANHSYPATYTGTVATGGSVSFDVSVDGTAITRIQLTDVPTECGTITTTVTGAVPIVNHAFDKATDPVRFAGSFPADQAAQGTFRYRQFFPSCTSSTIAWTARTTAPPPPPPPPVDRTPPVLVLSGATSQHIGLRSSFVVLASARSEACRVVASGTVAFAGSASSYRLRTISASIGKGRTTRLVMGVPSAALSAVRRALKKGRRVQAVVSVAARDAAGNRTTKRRTVRLVR